MPAKPRAIEGRLAAIGTGGTTATLAFGSLEGVLRGDRYEILQITGEIRDPVTKEVIDVEATKIGELVVDNLRDRTATGAYGGQPLVAFHHVPEYLNRALHAAPPRQLSISVPLARGSALEHHFAFDVDLYVPDPSRPALCQRVPQPA